MLKNKITFYFIIIILPYSISLAQSKIQLGIRLNPQSTSFQYETLVAAKDYLKLTPYYVRVRPAIGIGLTYQAYNHFFLGADLLYSMHGGGFEKRKTNINYLKIPFWIGFNTSNQRRLIFNIQTGFDIAWMTSAKVKYAGGESINIINYANRINWGAALAMGLKFKILKSYYLNTQVFVYKDFRSLSKTSSEFKVTDYIFPGIRLRIDKQLK